MAFVQDTKIITKKILIGIAAFIVPLVLLAGGLFYIQFFINK